MITSFRCRETERIFKGKFSATLPQAIQKTAARKLEIIDAARDLEDLRTPYGNRLEALSADTALRLSRFFGNSAQFWMNLQTRYELESARELSASSIDREVRPHAAA